MLLVDWLLPLHKLLCLSGHSLPAAQLQFHQPGQTRVVKMYRVSAALLPVP
jgi:hypothetical protein